MCILSSLVGVYVTHGDINVLTQIGFVVLVGLASKNAILIVEFAKHKHEEGGLARREATLAACRLRLRPILMTSFAFILGVVPLLVGHGAGAEMRKVLGVAVFSGMLGVTLFGIFLTPVFFYVVEWFVEGPLFSSARVRLLGTLLLYLVGVLTLGLFWIVPGVLRTLQRRRVRLVPGRPMVAVGNGDGLANGRGEVSVRRDERHAATGNGEDLGRTNGHAVSLVDAANGTEPAHNGAAPAPDGSPEPVKQE